MANLTTNQDIVNNALFNAGEPQNTNSDFFNQALIYLNRGYRAICSGGAELEPELNEDWYWLRKPTPGILTLQPAIAPTATVTFNSQSVTLSATVTPTLAGQFFNIPGDGGDYYIISAHTAGTAALTLDSPYTGSTNAAATARIAQLEYQLASDVQEVIGPMRVQRSGDEIDGADLARLSERFPLNTLGRGIPELYAMVGEQRVRFSHYPGDTSTDLLRVEYDYKMRPSDLAYDTNEPLIPREYRRILSDYVTTFLLLDKEDSKKDVFAAMVTGGLRGMAKNNRRSQEKQGRRFGQIEPRQDQLGRVRRVPRSTSGFYFFR
jgi:hypothetical protein